jgi:hypothetical protein
MRPRVADSQKGYKFLRTLAEKRKRKRDDLARTGSASIKARFRRLREHREANKRYESALSSILVTSSRYFSNFEYSLSCGPILSNFAASIDG